VQAARIHKTSEAILRRNLRHRTARSASWSTSTECHSSDHRLALTDKHTQADIVTFGSLEDSTAPSRTSTDSDIERTATASAHPLRPRAAVPGARKVRQSRLIEKRGHSGKSCVWMPVRRI